MGKQKPPKTTRIQDLTGVAPWLEQHDITVKLEKEPGGRVVGFAPATNEVYRLLAEYQAGPTVDILDFLAFQRRLRGRMLDLRDGAGRKRLKEERS